MFFPLLEAALKLHRQIVRGKFVTLLRESVFFGVLGQVFPEVKKSQIPNDRNLAPEEGDEEQ